MPVRAVLNVVYAMAVENKDAKERKEFDDALYGWGRDNEMATQDLWRERGGEG